VSRNVLNQSQNGRYINAGSRIDYVLVDRALCPEITTGTVDTSEAHVASMATAHGRWRQAPMEGGGIPDDAPLVVYNEHFNREAGTRSARMVYTPPRFSDHIGVAVNLPAVNIAKQNLAKDDKTKHAQPHRTYKSIASFFKKPQSANPAPPVATPTKLGVGKLQEEPILAGPTASAEKVNKSDQGTTALGSAASKGQKRAAVGSDVCKKKTSAQ
jgi:hypothetical protein